MKRRIFRNDLRREGDFLPTESQCMTLPLPRPDDFIHVPGQLENEVFRVLFISHNYKEDTIWVHVEKHVML